MDVLKYLTNCKVYSTTTQAENEEEWLHDRSHGIGGSDIGAICGVSPFTSARQIYLRKTGQYDESLEVSEAAKERMYFGRLLEPIVAEEYAHRTGNKLITLKATLQHKDYEWALANVDRLIVDDEGKPIGVLECKTSSEYNNEAWENGEILTSYIYQLNWYMWILGLDRGAIACLVGGNKFYHYDVFRNDELLNNIIIPKAKDFWFNNILALKEPELQSNDTNFVNSKYSEVKKNSEIILDDDIANELAKTVVECKTKVKELEAIIEEAQNKLKERLKDNEIGYTKDFIIKWSPRVSTRIDTTKLKKEFPEIYEKVKMKVEYRAMTIKGVIL